jgi:AcrR family transcriptional regulator
MARKTKEEAEKTRKAILDAALQVFTQNGFSRTSLHQIAQRAGCTRGAVYWHFSDKAGLFKVLHEEMEHRAGLDLDEQAFMPASSLDEIKMFFLHYIGVLLNNRAYRDFYHLVNFRTEWSEELAPLLELERQKLKRLLDALTKDFENLKRLGKIKPQIEPARTAAALYAYVEGIIGLWLFKPDSLPLKEWACPMLDDFMAGLAV